MVSLDVFRQDAFSVVTLTDAINKIPYVPQRISQLGIFRETGVTTTSVVVEERDGILELISPTPRGGPGHTAPRPARTARSLAVPHFERNDNVMADEVQNIRAFGSETDVETVQAKLAERMMYSSNDFAATQEYSRVGAVQGIITYADGSQLDLFNEFNVSEPAEVAFDLLNPTPVLGALRSKIADIARSIGTTLGAVSFTGLYAICGDNFFDALIAHPEVRQSYLGYQGAADLRNPTVGSPVTQGGWGMFPFAGVIWDNYFGSVGGTDFVDTDHAHVFPLGVPNLFRTYFAPADYIETVNTVGQRLYVKQYERIDGKGIHFDTQMNALDICTRPNVLISVRKGS